jgi:DNA polymerase III epsilon subunit-like protein
MELNLLVCPDPDRVTARALEVQGRTLEQVLLHPLTPKHAGDLLAWALHAWDAVFTVAGYNPAFDVRFLRRIVPNLADKTNADFIDALALARAKLPMLPSRKLSEVTRTLGIDHQAHDALGDARAAREVWRTLSAPGFGFTPSVWDRVQQSAVLADKA